MRFLKRHKILVLAATFIAILSFVTIHFLQFIPQGKITRNMNTAPNGCPNLDRVYADLVVASNPESFASLHGIYFDRGWTRAIYQLSKPQWHPTGDFVIDALSGNTVQVFIPVTDLCSLAKDQFVTSVYPLTANNSSAFSEHIISQSIVMVDPTPNELEKYSIKGVPVNKPNSDSTIYGHRNILWLGPTSGYSLPSVVAKGDYIGMLFSRNLQFSVNPVNGVVEQVSASQFGNQPALLAQNSGVVTITVKKPELTKIKSQVLYTVNVSTSAPAAETYSLDITQPGRTITVQPGTAIFLNSTKGNYHFWATPQNGILESPIGTYHRTLNEISFYRAVAPGTATITVTKLF